MNFGVSAFLAACCGVGERIRSCSHLENRDSLQFAAGSFNLTRPFTVSVVLLSGCLLFGCAHVTIPAPEAPVIPLPEPVIEDSTINLPVSVSLKSLFHDLEQAFSKGKEHDLTGQERNIAEKIRGFLQKQATRKDNNPLQNLYVRQIAGRAWDALQSPVKLTDDLFLQINPTAATISPLSGPSDTISVVVGLVAKPKLVARPVPPAPAQPLTTLTLAAVPPEKGFHIALESELSFEYLGSELTKKMGGRVYPAKGEAIVIENVTLYGSGSAVVVAVRVKGAVRGTIYLTGTPVYDEAARSFAVQNLEYTVETKQVLVKAADWLLHSRLKDGLAERTTWPVGDRIDAAKDLLASALNRKLNQHVSISGSIGALRPVSVGITKSSIKAVLVADGTVELNVL